MMSQTQTDFTHLLEGMGQEQENADGQPQPLHEYDVYVEPDRITFVKKTPEREDHTDRKKQPYFSRVLYMLLLLSSLFIQTASASTATEPTITITIFPKIQKIITTQTIQLPAR